MRFHLWLVFFLMVPLSSAYEIGVSPSILNMNREGHGYLTLINPNTFRVAYTLNSSAQLSRSEGIIEPQSTVRIGVSATKNSAVLISFAPNVQDLPVGISPQIQIPIKSYVVPITTGITVLLVVVLGSLLIVALIYARLRVYGS